MENKKQTKQLDDWGLIDFDKKPRKTTLWKRKPFIDRVIDPKPGERMLTYEETEELGRRLRVEAENPPTEEA